MSQVLLFFWLLGKKALMHAYLNLFVFNIAAFAVLCFVVDVAVVFSGTARQDSNVPGEVEKAHLFPMPAQGR